jgi:hypothetical protein
MKACGPLIPSYLTELRKTNLAVKRGKRLTKVLWLNALINSHGEAG